MPAEAAETLSINFTGFRAKQLHLPPPQNLASFYSLTCGAKLLALPHVPVNTQASYPASSSHKGQAPAVPQSIQVQRSCCCCYLPLPSLQAAFLSRLGTSTICKSRCFRSGVRGSGHQVAHAVPQQVCCHARRELLRCELASTCHALQEGPAMRRVRRRRSAASKMFPWKSKALNKVAWTQHTRAGNPHWQRGSKVGYQSCPRSWPHLTTAGEMAFSPGTPHASSWLRTQLGTSNSGNNDCTKSRAGPTGRRENIVWHWGEGPGTACKVPCCAVRDREMRGLLLATNQGRTSPPSAQEPGMPNNGGEFSEPHLPELLPLLHPGSIPPRQPPSARPAPATQAAQLPESRPAHAGKLELLNCLLQQHWSAQPLLIMSSCMSLPA